MNYKVQITTEAENDLRGIFEYISSDLQSVQNAVEEPESPHHAGGQLPGILCTKP